MSNCRWFLLAWAAASSCDVTAAGRGEHQAAQGNVPLSPPRLAAGAEADVGASLGEISGRVVNRASQSGVPGAEVFALPLSADVAAAKTMTEAGGLFRLSGLKPGLYRLGARRPGYLPAFYGQRSPADLARPVLLSGSQQLRGVDIDLVRGGGIAGRVMDVNGEPISFARVTAWPAEPRGSEADSVPRVETDDRGFYRLSGLEPGRYYLRIAEPRTARIAGRRDASPIPTFGGPLIGACPLVEGPVEVLGDADTDGTVLVVHTRRYRMQGTLQGSTARRFGAGIVSVFREPFLLRPCASAVLTEEGGFAFEDLPEGTYQIRYLGQRSTSDRASETEVATATVDLRDGDRLDISLLAEPAGRVSGRLEAADPRATLALRGAAITCVPVHVGPSLELPAVQPRKDLTFNLQGLSEACLLRVSAPGWYVATITRDGAAVADGAVELGPGISAVLGVTMAAASGAVAGVVIASPGSGPADVSIALVPFARANRAEGSPWLRVTRTDQGGRFVIDRVPPGEYVAVVVDGDIAGMGAEALDARTSTGQRVRVGDGATASVLIALGRR